MNRFLATVFLCGLLISGAYGETKTIDFHGGTYTGELVDGVPDGQGTLTFTNGAKYFGEFKAGKIHGKGAWSNPDGSGYVGEYKDGKTHGQGAFTFPDGRKYVGEFKDDKKHGQGVFIWPDGTKYDGEFQANQMHGQGALTFADGRKYVGKFKADKMHGQGAFTFPDGRKYVGELQANQFHGQGTLTLLDGSKFDGEWKNDVPYGQGTMTFADGRKYAAEYKDGKFNVSLSERKKADEIGITMEYMGGTYKGEVSDGVPHGHGTLTFADGSKFVGEFKDNKLWHGAKYDKLGNLATTYSEGVEEKNVGLGPEAQALHEKLQVILKKAFYFTPVMISEGTLDDPGPPITETCPADISKRVQAVSDEETKKLYEPIERESVLETSSRIMNKFNSHFTQSEVKLVVDALEQYPDWSKEEQEVFNKTDLGKRSQQLIGPELIRAFEFSGRQLARVLPEALEEAEVRLKLEGITKVTEDNWCLKD
ncbi:MAG: hypothetical protein CL877_09715 [Dehalococcoidales bacterium]|nr:hypothetical protein [Dehalococcoidales bacterium]